MKYLPVIGLEIHAQLSTRSKIFSPDPVVFGENPNSVVSPISLAHPGALPQLNEAAIKSAIKIGIATHCQIADNFYFSRKHYFYPDLPKGYQITQDNTPICFNGYLEIGAKTIKIERIHLEEDAGKNIHDYDPYYSLLDYNRAGTGLIEIVSAPQINSAEEAVLYVSEIRKLLRYLDICDGNMEEGSLRCDVNISLKNHDSTKLGVRVEIKNMNSISNIGRAINYEISRQKELLDNKKQVTQETRLWDAQKGVTVAIRSKESAAEYRYFPEPDILPILLSNSYIDHIKKSLPELPAQLYNRYVNELGLPEHDAELISEDKKTSDYYNNLIQHTNNYLAASKWLNGPIKTYLNQMALGIESFPISASTIAKIIRLIDEKIISYTVAKDSLFNLLLAHPEKDPESLIITHNLELKSDTNSLIKEIEKVLDENPKNVELYKKGKTGLLGFFVGKVMTNTGGKYDPSEINKTILNILNNLIN